MKWLSDRAVERLRAAGSEIDLSNTKYRLVEPIGRGGMGTVYRVEDPFLEREVALKVLDVEDPEGELATRLMQEARVLARLEHPGIVPVYDVGELADGRIFYTMKLVRGERLDRWARSGVSLRGRLTLFRRLCEAVGFAHAHQVLHRDLKPANVMVGSFGEVLVVDWGVAKILRSDGEPIHRAREHDATAETLNVRAPGVMPATQHGSILGTPGYMAPEQARGEIDRLDARTDVHALGAVLGFLLDAEPADFRVPRALRAVVHKAMSVEPAQRYATAADLAGEIDRFLEGRPVLAHPESVATRAGKFLWRNRVAVMLLLAYAVARAVALLSRGS